MILLFLAALISAVAAGPASAGLTAGACVQQPTPARAAEPCVPSTALLGATGLAVVPDGATVLVASTRSGALTALDAQTLGWRGCVSDDATDGVDGTNGRCADGRALKGAKAVAASPDGRHAYVAATRSGALSVFELGSGAPVQVACLKASAYESTCGAAPGLAGARAVTLSADGRHLYVAAAGADAVTAFARDAATGRLAFVHCISADGSDGACDDGSGLTRPSSIALSPDGQRAYATAYGSNALAVFARDGASGRLRQLQCLMARPPRGSSCSPVRELSGAYGVAVAPSGDVFVAARSAGAVTRLTPDAQANGLRPVACVMRRRREGCGTGPSLFAPESLVATASRVLVSGARGTLTELTLDLRPAACLSAAALARCTAAPPLAGASGLAVTPSGARAFVTGAAAVTSVEVAP